jgi:phage/plasmid-like protein (TIGR03299 family)
VGHYFKQGFSVREPMWHGLGTILDDYPGRKQAMKIAGHDFKVVEFPVFAGSNPLAKSEEGGQAISIGEPRLVADWKALHRNDTKQIIACVRDSYQVVQNETLWDVCDALVSEPNVKYETAGVLKDGAILWVLAWLDEPKTLKGDDSPLYPFVLVSTTHDGTGALRAGATTIRVVCWNTFSAATWQKEREYVFRHTAQVMSRIDEAKAAITGARKSFESMLANLEELLAIKINDKQRERFLSEFVPMPPKALITDRVAQNIEEARSAIRSILASETTAKVAGTGFGLVQAAVEYLDHVRSARSPETRFGRALLRAEPMKLKAAALVRQVAKSKN